ncbi:MAG: hypothetical protein J6W52_00450 [Bacteroidaceae bacterium]|nr:hypothetical protein [Bacteroidaceae bacterium]
MIAIKTMMQKKNFPALQGKERGWIRWGWCACFLIFLSSCGDGRPISEIVAEEDSLCIDTVATLDEVPVPETETGADSLTANR